MANVASQLSILIKMLYDGKGAKAATKDLTGLGKATTTASVKQAAMAQRTALLNSKMSELGKQVALGTTTTKQAAKEFDAYKKSLPVLETMTMTKRTSLLNKKMVDLGKQVLAGKMSVKQAAVAYDEYNRALGDNIDTTSHAEKATATLTGGLKSFAITAGVAAGAAVAVGVATKKAFDFSREGAALNQLEESFNLMNASVFKTPDLLDKMDKAARGTVGTSEMMAGLLTLTAGATDELARAQAEAAPKLMEIAKAANKLNPTLGSTGFLFESLARGIKRSSPLILDNTGLVIKVGQANEEWAAKMGMTVEAMSAQDKQFALLAAALKAGDKLIDQVGGDVGSLTDSYNKLTNAYGTFIQMVKKDVATNDKFVKGAAESLDLRNRSIIAFKKLQLLYELGAMSGRKLDTAYKLMIADEALFLVQT